MSMDTKIGRVSQTAADDAARSHATKPTCTRLNGTWMRRQTPVPARRTGSPHHAVATQPSSTTPQTEKNGVGGTIGRSSSPVGTLIRIGAAACSNAVPSSSHRPGPTYAAS
ncbi:hypothetical protein GCM10022255_110490 [Dactylosporangium darangshiense]|uniref:Uncharacterized protein n=1 Tax=Dactylosporangium darangshiense TaxID=579108 RepID=A0ABP8DUN7_9ACTN